MEQLLTVLAVLISFLLAVVAAVAICWFASRLLVGKPMTTEQLAEYERRFQERLLQPKWDELCSLFGFPMPRSLRELYSNLGVLTRENFYVRPPNTTNELDHHFIARWQPADSDTVRDTYPIGENRFPFASDDFGNYYFVELSPNVDDPPVFYYDHDGGDVSTVADSLSSFLAWPIYTQGRSA